MAEDREESHRERERDRERERPMYDTRESSYAYAEDDLDDYPRRRRDDRDRGNDYRSPTSPRQSSGALPYPPPSGRGGVPYPGDSSSALAMPGAFDFKDDKPQRSDYRTVSPPPDSAYRSSKEKVDAGRDSRVRYSYYRDDERSSPRPEKKGREFGADDILSKFLPQKYRPVEKKSEPPQRRRRDDSDSDSDDESDDTDVDDRRRRPAEDYDKYGRRRKESDADERRHRFQLRGPSPPSNKAQKKAEIEEGLAYGKMAGEELSLRDTIRQSTQAFTRKEQDLLSKYGYSGHDSGYPPEKKTARFERDHERERERDKDPRRSSSNVLTVDQADRRRDRSPAPPTNKMSSLSVNTGHHSFNMSLAAAPPSPLLESYHGTYQSCSPMPSPLMLPQHDGNAIIDVAPLSPDGDDARINRRARFHVPEVVAEKMANALKGDRRAPDTDVLIQILPGLSHEEVMELRAQYKALVKAGTERKGVNVAKHIRSRLRDEDPNLMKACYATALGQWESEAYWANYWYQGDKTRRELLIESLMGRTNTEIRLIKDGFHDKKYGDSLTRCMKTELKEDKFKKAVLLALGEERMEDVDSYGRPLEVNMKLVDQDVEDLRHAVKSEKGGETLMISIVVLRSDAHLREVLREYSHHYKSNFARDALKKSTNLVVSLIY